MHLLCLARSTRYLRRPWVFIFGGLNRRRSANVLNTLTGLMLPRLVVLPRPTAMHFLGPTNVIKNNIKLCKGALCTPVQTRLNKKALNVGILLDIRLTVEVALTGLLPLGPHIIAPLPIVSLLNLPPTPILTKGPFNVPRRRQVNNLLPLHFISPSDLLKSLPLTRISDTINILIFFSSPRTTPLYISTHRNCP